MSRHIIAALGLFLGTCTIASVQAQDAEVSGDRVMTAVLETKADIERDTEELIRIRTDCAAQRKPLATRLESLQERVIERRAEAERIRRLRQQGEKEQMALVAKAEALEDECRFILTVFSEYRRAMETRVNAAEGVLLAEKLSAIDSDLAEAEAFANLPRGIGRLLELSAERNHSRLGGEMFAGVALDSDGIEHRGSFAVFGPIAYFASEGGDRAGLAVTQFGNAQPSIYDHLAEEIHANIDQVVAGGEAILPIDVTSGNALKVKEAKATLVEHALKGGFVMIPLLLVGVLAVVVAVWKTIDLSRVRVKAGDGVQEVVAKIRAGDIAAARQQAAALKEPLASLLAEGIEHRDSPRDHLEEIMHEYVLSVLPRIERHLGTLAVFGGIAPLLGLLGTVTGMIHTFQLVTVFGSGDAKLLSGGISEALVTTEFGLAIAIPVLLVHATLARRARSIVGALEQTAVSVVNDLKLRTDDT